MCHKIPDYPRRLSLLFHLLKPWEVWSAEAHDTAVGRETSQTHTVPKRNQLVPSSMGRADGQGTAREPNN